ncbi:MAG: hypothetical protein C4529_02385 [Deltaproteobacteria bacterium]|nr:MAG: hypothetical protein C4529_02385 [Deltaproteobacteria bacterium]
MRRPAAAALLGLSISLGPNALAVDGYRLYESTVASVNGEVLFLSDIVREGCFHRCAAMPGSEPEILSARECRDRLISDTLVLQEQRKLQLGQVDNMVLSAYGAESLERMGNCTSSCKEGITAERTREWVERKLLIREFFQRRVAGFVEVKEEDVQREFRLRAARADNAAELSEDQIREELQDAKVAQEIRNWYTRAASKSRVVLSPLEAK